MAPFLNAKGQPVKMSFFDLFGPSTPSGGSKKSPRPQNKTPKTEETPSTETSPQSAAATEAPTEPTKTSESASAEWTKVEEMALLGMKAKDMSWKEIGEALPGKDLENIKKKYKELYVDVPANVKPKEAESKKEETKEEKKTEEKKEVAKATEESKEVAEDKKGGKVGKQGDKYHWKSQKGQKGKGKAEAAKPGENKTEEAKPEGTKGILKAKATLEEKGKGGELKSIDGHPIIFVDDDEELEFDELLYLYALNARYDEQKWITVDSKFYDKFGKRVGTAKLKEKMANAS